MTDYKATQAATSFDAGDTSKRHIINSNMSHQRVNMFEKSIFNQGGQQSASMINVGSKSTLKSLESKGNLHSISRPNFLQSQAMKTTSTKAWV